MNRHFALLAATAMTAATTTFLTTDADACGGCFVPPAETEGTVVTGHRMALSVSTTQSVLWDQILYAGDPEEFSWVLPIKPGARLELSTDAWFEALEAATQTTVQAPPEGCAAPDIGGSSGFACGAASDVAGVAFADGSAGGNNGVQVVHQGTVGPYETVTLSATDPNALNDWLAQHGYDVPDDIQPIIDEYVAEEFDFIALRLQPGQGVRSMKPVRVVTPGASSALPLRMVAAGTGANVPLVLFIIGEGRMEAANFDNGLIPPSLVTWDFIADQSNYSELRATGASANEGRTWLTTYAQRGALLSPVNDPLGFGGPIEYTTANFAVADTIAESYVNQGIENGESGYDSDYNSFDCIANFGKSAKSIAKVVDPCADVEEGADCPAISDTYNELDKRLLECGELDDVATALLGMHPADVVVTRIEADLPRAALADDLMLQASDDQRDVDHRFIAGLSVNNCWDQPSGFLPLAGNAGRPGGPKPPLTPGDLALLVLGGLGLATAYRRRRRAQTEAAAAPTA